MAKPTKPIKVTVAKTETKPATGSKGTSYGSTRSAAVNKGQQGALMSAAGKAKAAANKLAAKAKKPAVAPATAKKTTAVAKKTTAKAKAKNVRAY